MKKSKHHLFYQKLPHWHDPEQAFLTLYANKKHTFWFDNKDYSYIGQASQKIKYTLSNHTLKISNNNKTQTIHQSIFTYLKKELANQKTTTNLPFDFIGGFVGYFGYEMQGECGSKQFYKSPFPDAFFFFVDKFLVFDHRQKCVYLVTLAKDKKTAADWLSVTTTQLSSLTSKLPPLTSQPPSSPSLTFNLARDHKQYLKDIRACQKYLLDGHAYQICLTNQITTKVKTNWLHLFRVLRETNPAPFSTYMNFSNFALLSSSPEQFLHIDKKGWVTSKPMKGTLRRGATKEEDKKLASALGKTEKDYAENMMIVDLVRNDLGRVCEIGSIKITQPLSVETYPTVHQLVSTITGKLRPGLTAIDLLQAAFPGGSMTGAPKIRAMEIISELEGEARGIYSGCFGFLSLNGTTNLAMTIRTIIATIDELSFGTGGAILTDSIPESEYKEMLLKAQALIKAITQSTGANTYKIIHS